MRSTTLSVDRVSPDRPSCGGSAYGQAARVGLASVYAAPAVMMGRCALYLIAVWVLSAFWDRVGSERPSVGLVQALPAGGLALYIAVTEWIALGTHSVHLRLEDDIRSGDLEARLLRPKSHLMLRLAESLGATIGRLVVIGAMGLTALAVAGRDSIPLHAAPWVLLVGVLGAILATLSLALVGLSAFWLRQITPAYLINQKAGFLFGGLVAPVTFYPDWLAQACLRSPFAGQLYWPAAVALDPRFGTIAFALADQAAWIAILGLACAGLWRLGLAKVLREGAWA